MELHGALNDFKRSQGDPQRFPGERRSTTGLFSGLDERLVHVSRDGSVRDYSYPLSGLTGIERSRFGLERDGDVHWFESDDTDQHYVGETAVVETTHTVGESTCIQYDLTIGSLHVTHFVLEEETGAEDVSLHACLGFAPEGRAGRIGQLWHGDAVEIHHDTEHDFLAASAELSVTGQVPERFAELLATEPADFPRSPTDDRYEEARLSPIVLGEIEVTESSPYATIVTLLSDDGDRPDALERVRTAAAEYADLETILEAGREQARDRLPDPDHGIEGGGADLRALALLRAPTGARMAGPEFDPFYRYSGGYGYTWFRDDAEISRFLLDADRRLGLGLDDWHAKSSRFYIETQLSDGTWPHRVWPSNGELAPGWAHGRIEEGDSEEYQADQTASVAAYLAASLRHVDPTDERVRETLAAALDGLDDSLAADGLPVRVQNAWENMTGRFAHTAATFLEAYAAIARAPIDDALAERARENARAVYESLDDLWVPERGIYAMRTADGDVDDRIDGSTLALVSAHREYDALEDVDDERLDRLVSHVETTLDELYRNPEGPVEGLARFEGDPWRVRDQGAAKIWTVTTAWGANAAITLSELLVAHGRGEEAQAFEERGRTLLALVSPGGPLRRPGGYLPEQVFDDGTADSATPLGWPHAIRLATASALESTGSSAVADTENRPQLHE